MDHHHHHHLTTPNSPPLVAASSWSSFREPMEAATTTEGELRECLLRARLELETTRAAAQEELQRMEGHALRLARFLEAATRERDEARLQCHSLLHLMDRQHHHHHLLPTIPPPISVDDVSNVILTSSSKSSSEESESSVLWSAEIEAIAERRGLPEKGRLVEAVMGAGPLLQTLLLAGQLPQWRHPPPTLQSFEIPPALMMISDGSKREMEFCSGQMYHPSPTLPSSPWSLENNNSIKYEGINQPN